MTTPTDYEMELARIDAGIPAPENGMIPIPSDVGKATELAYRLSRRASLTGRLDESATAEIVIDEAIRRLGPWADLCLLKANLDFKFHRLAETRRDLELAPGLAASPLGSALCADLDLQEGRYDEAEAGYEAVIARSRTWDNLARLAHLKATLGDVDGAEQLYLDAEDEITAKEMRAYAWVKLQRGLLDLSNGRYDGAWGHYARAGEAYSGYWLIDQHIADLLRAEGRFEEAVALYEGIVARVPRPEIAQAVGDLYASMDQPDLARTWHAQALAGYLESVLFGDVHYLHHLVDYYADVELDGAEAVIWARKDLDLRRNASTQAALAWALYRAGQFIESLDAIRVALSFGVRDAQLLSQAAMIHTAAGQPNEGDRLMHEAAAINPHYGAAHVHH
ncbi:MAG: hypothetical protein QOF01_2631 [Thermomicrobiales bacterium]|nr:hypothetical protein [Thermomicrobiales bacterium]